jgi:NAD(P)H-hydrate epimerase
MDTLPLEIYPVDVVRDIDRCAIDTHGIPGYTLMTRAAESALAAIDGQFPAARCWLVLAGPGNNAGDAYVLARLARARGIDVTLMTLADPAGLGGDAATAAADYREAGGTTVDFDGALPTGHDLIVDGLFGSGLVREVGGRYAAVIEQANAAPAPIVALDIPSGVAGDSGAALGTAVEAALTVAFVGLKAGYFLGEGIDRCGRLVFAGLDVPEVCYPRERALLERIPDDAVARHLSPRRRNAHKGDFGHVVIVGGAPGMPGAALMAGKAALRSGAGRVSVATHPEHAGSFVAACPELMVRGVRDADELTDYAGRADVVALGPGLGDDAWSEQVFAAARQLPVPAVWDAGALTFLAASPGGHPDRIITPHPGEAARLLGRSTAAVQADRPGALRDLVAANGGVVVLKGACTLIGTAEARPLVSTRGNPGMATAGAGDILTGIIAGLRAQGLPSPLAAQVGVAVHAGAGDLAAEAGERGLIATDLLAGLRRMLNP